MLGNKEKGWERVMISVSGRAAQHWRCKISSMLGMHVQNVMMRVGVQAWDGGIKRMWKTRILFAGPTRPLNTCLAGMQS